MQAVDSGIPRKKIKSLVWGILLLLWRKVIQHVIIYFYFVVFWGWGGLFDGLEIQSSQRFDINKFFLLIFWKDNFIGIMCVSSDGEISSFRISGGNFTLNCFFIENVLGRGNFLAFYKKWRTSVDSKDRAISHGKWKTFSSSDQQFRSNSFFLVKKEVNILVIFISFNN